MCVIERERELQHWNSDVDGLAIRRVLGYYKFIMRKQGKRQKKD